MKPGRHPARRRGAGATRPGSPGRRRRTLSDGESGSATGTLPSTTAATADPSDAPARARSQLLALLGLLALVGCGTEEVVHGLDERQANEVVVALDEAGLRAQKRREDGDGAWAVAVPAGAAGQAQRVLSERELPRQRPPGFGEVFGKGSMVPTAVEERALYLHALAGELARSVEAIDGVVEARVHLALPPADPLRAAPAPPPRAAVLVKCRSGQRGALDPLAPGIQSLVAGAVEGLDAAAVSVVLAEAQAPAAPPRAAGAPLRTVVFGSLAAAAAVLAVVLAVAGAGTGVRAWWARLRARSAA